MDITRHLTLVATLKRNTPAEASSGAWADKYAPVKTGVRCRISQPPKVRAVVGLQDAADLEPTILFEPDEDVRDQDRVAITGGEPALLVGTEWDVHSPVLPSVPVYLSARARRIQTQVG